MKYRNALIALLGVVALAGAGCPTAEERAAAQAAARELKVGSKVMITTEEYRYYGSVEALSENGVETLILGDVNYVAQKEDVTVIPAYENVVMGDSVYAAWTDNYMYPAKVVKTGMDTITVSWDDGGGEADIEQGKVVKVNP